MHEPDCPLTAQPYAHTIFCECDLIAKVRADEREKIAAGMKAEADDFRRAIQKKERERMCQQVSALDTILHDDPSSRSGVLVDWVRLDAVLEQLARNGGSDERQG